MVVCGEKLATGNSALAKRINTYLTSMGEKVGAIEILDMEIRQTASRWSVTVRQVRQLKKVQQLLDDFDYILIDATRALDEVLRSAMLMANNIIIPLCPDGRDLKLLSDLDPLLNAVRGLNPEVKIQVVMNLNPPADLAAYIGRIRAVKEIIGTFGIEVIPTTLYHRDRGMEYEIAEMMSYVLEPVHQRNFRPEWRGLK